MHENHAHPKVYACNVCQIREKSILAARSHYRENHSERPLICHQCGNSFSSMIQVHHHLVTHHVELVGKIEEGQQEFSCVLCQKVTNTGKKFQFLA